MPAWVLARVNKLVWGFVWGSRCETVSRNTLSLAPGDGGLGESNFILNSYALLLSLVISAVNCPDDPSFYLCEYFASTRAEWAHLRNMSVPNASSPTPFYVFALRVLSDVPDLSDFSSKRIYLRLLSDLSSPPSLPVQVVSRCFCLLFRLSAIALLFRMIYMRISRMIFLG